MSFLLAPLEDKKPTSAELHMLEGDSQLIVVAGSDTTASTLISILYSLAKSPSLFSILRDEISTLASQNSNKPLSNQELQSLPYLNGVISEALRLYPAAGMLQRKTPPSGITIGDKWIPGNVTVFCPAYVVGRNENIYTDAEAFRPERWFAGSNLIKEPSAFAPFSKGKLAGIKPS
ncbi:MAG: hypothetical protein Q9195_007780 [Heterodermia aff. obscurata]